MYLSAAKHWVTKYHKEIDLDFLRQVDLFDDS